MSELPPEEPLARANLRSLFEAQAEESDSESTDEVLAIESDSDEEESDDDEEINDEFADDDESYFESDDEEINDELIDDDESYFESDDDEEINDKLADDDESYFESDDDEEINDELADDDVSSFESDDDEEINDDTSSSESTSDDIESIDEESASDNAENVESEEEKSDEEVEEEEPPIIYHYRISVPIVDELARQINVARGSVGMGSALIGSFVWQVDFKTEQLETVQTALRDWIKAHLPLTVTVERIEALVEGQQRYIAAFALEPAETIQKAQQSLKQALASNIETLENEDFLPFSPQLPIADHVTAPSFPKLIHMLQLNFDPTEWRIDTVELLHTPEGDIRWEVLEAFRA